MNASAATASPSTTPSCVMLLSWWAAPDSPWHARLVGADAHVHEFASPFELARFVAQAEPAPVERSTQREGLR
jgi:hypothetical protein